MSCTHTIYRPPGAITVKPSAPAHAREAHPTQLFTPGEVQFNFATGAPAGQRLARTEDRSLAFMLAPPHGHGAFGSVSYATDRDGRRYLAKCLYTQPSFEQQQAGVKVTHFNKALKEWTVAREVPLAIQNHAIITTPESTVQLMDLMDGDWSGVARLAMPENDAITLNLEAFLQSSLHLSRFHQAGYVHGDVKLDNLLWSRDGRIAWADYGITRRLDPAGYLRGLRGTPYAMAPEILYGLPYDEQADVWAMGVALGEMFVGEQNSPFRFAHGKPRTLNNMAPIDVQRFRYAAIDGSDGRLDTSKLAEGHTAMHHFFRTWYGIHPESCRFAAEYLLVNDAWNRVSVGQAYDAARAMTNARPGHANDAARLLGRLPVADASRAAAFAGLNIGWRAWERGQTLLAKHRAKVA